jgi:small subunit ribosomal protein S11
MIKQKKKQTEFFKKKKRFGILYIQSTKNNTIITLTDSKGNTKGWASSGSIGFKNSRKSTSYAAQAATEKMIKQALQLGFKSVIIKVKGLGYGKQSSTRTIRKSKLKVKRIQNRTPVPHNGCRPRKKRRL